MAGALGVVQTTDVPVEGRAAIPAYVDDSLPIVGPSRAVQVMSSGPFAGGPPMPIRLAPPGTPAIGPALPIYIVSGILDPLAYTNKVKVTAPSSLIGYWSLADPVGSATAADESGNGRTGAYTAVTLGQPGAGDGRTSASFDGSTSYCNVYSASLAAAFIAVEGTIAAWIRTSAWADGVTRRIVYLSADANNRVILGKNNTNQLNFTYTAGGTAKTVFPAETRTTWIHLALTWSKAADQMIAYVNGAQAGSTQTGLGVWAGTLAVGGCLIGAQSTVPANDWNGLAAHAALWGTALSAAQIASLATVNTW